MKEQIVLLEMHFAKSPRVAILLGLRFEAMGEIGKAKKVYQELLDKDETNVVSGQRLTCFEKHELMTDGASTQNRFVPLHTSLCHSYPPDLSRRLLHRPSRLVSSC